MPRQQGRQVCPAFRAIFTRTRAQGHRIHQAVNRAESLTYYKIYPIEPSYREEGYIRSWSHREGWVILFAPAVLEIERCNYCSSMRKVVL